MLYQARTRHQGKVVYFNFMLAQEMGLIDKNHPHELNPELTNAILHTFAIQIINEYDVLHKTPIPPEDIRENCYMATRYLQLQHPNKKGKTSGDGRSIWNGQFSKNGKTWDISSCGTGATCLSPATAIEGTFFRTGTRKVGYGCGLSDVSEGISAAVMSEVFHRSGVPTERTLAIIEFPQGRSINVRASDCLLRPSHFFHHLKQGNYDRLKSSVDFYIDRQVANGDWKLETDPVKKYTSMVEHIASAFAQSVAIFEHNYIFVWLDWDGDNILTNGGIIDYGSVRQFGLYHHEYRYDDVERWSTNIPEQKRKARDILQTFAQLRDYLITRTKKSKDSYKKDASVKLFEQRFSETRRELFLSRLGFSKELSSLLLTKKQRVENFRLQFAEFEELTCSKGLRNVADGVTADAILNMRDLARELPKFILTQNRLPHIKEFLNMCLTKFANRRDKRRLVRNKAKVGKFLKHYMKFIEDASKLSNQPFEHVMLEIMMRAANLNKRERLTGNGVLMVTDVLCKERKKLSQTEFQSLVERFIDSQVASSRPKLHLVGKESVESPLVEKTFIKLQDIVSKFRHSI